MTIWTCVRVRILSNWRGSQHFLRAAFYFFVGDKWRRLYTTTMCTGRRGTLMTMAYLGALRRVPRIGATGPRQVTGEGSEKEVQRPCDDDVVEEVDVESDEDDGESDACMYSQLIRLAFSSAHRSQLDHRV